MIHYAKDGGWNPGDARYKRISNEELHQRKKERRARELKQQQDDLAKEKAAQAEAERLRSLSKPIDYYPPHKYVIRKKIVPYSAWALDNILLIPMIDIGKQLKSLQRIFKDGEKRYLSGTKKKGLFCPIGKVFSADHIAIVEGYATGCTVHDLTGLPIAVAFDSSNLMSVVEVFYRRHPNKLITIYGDNDRLTEKKTGQNTGIASAEKACERFKGVGLLVPDFPDDAPIELSDFNDLVLWNEGVFYEG